MVKYRDIPMSQRIDKIGELLAKGIYLYIQKQKELEKAADNCHKNINSENSNPSGSALSQIQAKNGLN
jgi:hypothetical protein